MTRRDYVAIAAAIKAARWVDDSFMNATVDSAAEKIADVMQADNARFDRQRFLVACGAA